MWKTPDLAAKQIAAAGVRHVSLPPAVAFARQYPTMGLARHDHEVRISRFVDWERDYYGVAAK